MTDHSSNARRLDQMQRRSISLAGGSLKTDIGEAVKECEVHGPFTSKGIKLNIGAGREIWTQCPQCLKEAEEREEAEQIAKAAEMGRRRLDAALGASGMPSRFHSRRFDTFVASTPSQQSALNVCIEYSESFERSLQIGGSLVLAGKPGTGKSHLAASIMHALMPKYGTRYMTCMDMIRSIRDTWRKGSEMSETQVLNELTKLDLLVIDEVGVQYGTDGEQTIIFDILDRRYREEMPVVLMTNQDAKGFREFIGDRCHDRLKEVGRWVPFDWESYRPQARKELESQQ